MGFLRAIPAGSVNFSTDDANAVASLSSFRPLTQDAHVTSLSEPGATDIVFDENDSDWQLVQRVQRGDKRGFDLLVIKYQQRLAAVISRYLRNPAEVADITQETFIRAYRAIASFRGDSAFYTWLFRIGVNAAKNQIAMSARRIQEATVDVSVAEQLADPSSHSLDTPDRQLQKEQLKTAIYAAIDALPDDLRAALTLREFDGLSYDDIAAILVCPVGTVRSRIFRAREFIDQRIRELLV